LFENNNHKPEIVGNMLRTYESTRLHDFPSKNENIVAQGSKELICHQETKSATLFLSWQFYELDQLRGLIA